jgi:hypothetical protein
VAENEPLRHGEVSRTVQTAFRSYTFLLVLLTDREWLCGMGKEISEFENHSITLQDSASPHNGYACDSNDGCFV